MKRMQIPRLRQSFTALLGAFIAFSLVSIPTLANHAWGTYHWKGTTPNTRNFTVGDNVSGDWDLRLQQAESDWENPDTVVSNQYNLWYAGSLALRDHPTGDTSKVPPSEWKGTPPVTMDVVPGSAGSNCSPVAGTIQVCAANYGSNGWMGLAQIWVSQKHITQATAKMNDYYFTDVYYSQFGDQADAALAADQQLVMCQEIAHGFGLTHNDENFGNTNTGTCMDYGNTPWGDEHPNYHDYDQLAAIYAHSDSTSTKGGGKKGAAPADEAASERPLGPNPEDWGQVIEYDGKGRPSHFRKDLGEGRMVFTFVIYADHASGVEIGPGQSNGGQADGGHSHDGAVDNGGHAHEGDHGKQADSKRDGGKKADGKRDGGKRDGGKQRQGDRDRHRHR
jgi:hypothetical protein